LDNHACFAYNRIGQISTLRSAVPLPVGVCEVRLQFTKTAEHTGIAQLQVDGQPVGEMPITLLPWRQSVVGMDVGADHGSTVSPDYAAPFLFEGRLHQVDYLLGTDRADVQRAAAIEARNALVDQ
jgi:arylsulfatase